MPPSLSGPCRPVLIALGSLLASIGIVPAQDPGTSYRFRVELDQSPATTVLLRDFDVPAACCGDPEHLRGQTEIDVLVAPGELARFRALGLRHRLLDRGRPFAAIEFERQQSAPPGPLAPDAKYYSVQEIETELLKLEQQYPTLALRVDVTQYTGTAATHENRHLYALKISDDVKNDEDEPTALLAAQHHARELNSPHMVIGAARRILAGYASDPVIRAAVDDYELWLVPCVNPDGVNYVWTRDNYWRKNRRDNGGSYGVDLNRNYPFQWGQCGSSSTTPSSQTYRGPAAGSEPETQTMMALARKERFAKYLDFHSSGREVLYTYNSCQHNAYSGQPLRGVEQHYRDVIRAAMSYGTRAPSASGEAQEWHCVENGTLGYLVEIGTSFQPVFSATEAEEARVWPGIRVWLGLRPSVHGPAVSLKRRAPIAVAIDPAQALGTNQGERARGAAGHYHLWLPPGPFDLPISAEGHLAARLVGTAPAQGQSSTLDVTLVPILPVATLTVPATHKMGTKDRIVFDAQDPGRPFWIPFALGTSPGIPVGPRTLPLNGDAAFFLAANDPLGPVYAGHTGRLDAQGRASATLSFPPVPALSGLTLWFVGLTLEGGWPSDVKTWSVPQAVRLSM